MKYHVVTQTEATTLHKLRHVFAVAFEDEETYISKPPSETYLKNLLQKPTNIVVVATADNNEVVGGLIAYELQNLNKNGAKYIFMT